MGVHGLWPLLHPVARPVALETMGGKKLAIDSSIWLYQFQIAMRDKEGRALDNAHILGFLRRICKLLFYGIKPVFVFDGGAPVIKKVAISNRKNRKQGARETAARTAEKLLAAQLRAAAIKQARKDNLDKQAAAAVNAEVEDGDGDLNYMDDDYGIAPRGAPQRRAPGAASSSSPARPNNAATSTGTQPVEEEDLIPKKKKYVHKDQYALPVIEGPISARGAPSDPRLATEAELRSFIDEMRPEDFDVDSDFFANLPVEAKYEIIGDLRIKSRQSNYKRVEAMKSAPTPLDFSRAQILGLSHRNKLTQKLLTVTDSLSRVQPMAGATRIAGERNKEYVLIKNDSAEGTGYVLGVRQGGDRPSSPVKIDTTTTDESDHDKTSTDEDFEQVQIPQHLGYAKRSVSPDAEMRARRQEMAEEAIRQRYSPVKPVRRRGDSPIDDLPALPPQKPLFATNNGTEKKKKARKPAANKASNSAAGFGTLEEAMAGFQPDAELWEQIQSAVAGADIDRLMQPVEERMGSDEERDLQAAIEASKQDQLRKSSNNGPANGHSTEVDDGEDSDVSFDEVEAVQAPASVAQRQPSRPAEEDENSDDSVEYVSVEAPASRPATTDMVSRPEPPKVTTSPRESPPPRPSKANAGPLNMGVQSTMQADRPSDDAQHSAISSRKPSGMHIDIPDAAYRPPSPQKEQVRPARPDLTDAQAERDVSPQVVQEVNGVVQRDYAPQPHSPAAEKRLSPASAIASLAPVFEQSSVDHPAARPSVMSRTLSTHSERDSPDHMSETSEEARPLAKPSLVPNASAADNVAVTGGPISVLDEVQSTLSASEEDGLAKGDLQDVVENGNVRETVSSTSKAQKLDASISASQAGRSAAKANIAEDERASSPEIVYEWSPSPEPVARKRADPTLLAPDDPNYIPPDIDFAEPGHELSDLDDEDQEHLKSLTSEQAEYAKFLAELKSRNLEDMENEVDAELTGLREQDKRDKKMADDITVQMAKDIQHLLKVLGLPYVIAPMEAEAQCAELLSRTLVDGVITDDNDVFLFGATRVYKNMFNQNKYVECYLATDIDRELALDRQRMIRLAHFLGSDYCDGLPGVGPVLGMELMAEFPGSDGLTQFRDWWLKVQRGRDTPADHPTAFRRKFKKSKRELYIDEGWPNPEVQRAYLHPEVDTSDQPFFWGIPDLDALRDFLRDNLGWGTPKTDDLMLPIIRKMTGRAAGNAVNQATISNFFDVSGGTGRYAPMSSKGYQSKRLQNVVKAWRASQQQLAKEEGSEEDEDLQQHQTSSSASKRSGSRSRPSGSRKNSGARASSMSRRSSKQGSSQGGAQSDDSDGNFNAELEAKLAKMGVKRKRETAVGSNRIVKPAKRSKKEKRRSQLSRTPSGAASHAQDEQAQEEEEAQALFAQASGSEEDDDGPTVMTKAASRVAKPRKRKAVQKAVAANSDEYNE